ncbi:MAG: helix-turn-helix domain-containing protein [Desulfatibacillum sp.]|nr:helix-turn-helix domain-containing protein [Desulfatibacillum sp.]
MNHTDLERLADMVAARILAETRAASAPKRWMTVAETMAYVSLKSKKTIRMWINEGYVYAHRTTGKWLIDRESVDSWLEENKVWKKRST